MTITVLYTCSCGISDAPVEVPARTSEDVALWVSQVMGSAIGEDHARRSPHCMARTMTHVKVPITGTDKIGGVPIN